MVSKSHNRIPRPTKAVVLAAGLGTRLRPLSHDLPKALMPLWGKPMLEHSLRLLASWGVREVVVNCHHQPSEVFETIRDRLRGVVRVNVSFEPDILGTGGALRKMEWFFDQHPFWLLNADVAADMDPAPLRKCLAKSKTLAALWLHPSQGPRTVELQRNWISNFDSRHPGAPGTFTFCGLHLLSPEILRFLPEAGFASIITAYQKAQRRGYRIAGVSIPESFWVDIGTPEQYLSAHREVYRRFNRRQRGGRLFNTAARAQGLALRRRGVRLSGFVALGQNVLIAPGARLKDSVLWDGAQAGPQTDLEEAIVGRNVRVHGSVRYMVLRSELLLTPHEKAALQNLGWKVEQTTANLMGPRGSARSFIRLDSRLGTLILIRYETDRKENLLYAEQAKFLARLGFRVPTLLGNFPDQKFLFMEDLGDRSLQELAPRLSSSALLNIYRKILAQVRLLHREGARQARRQRLQLMVPFSPKLYRWEHNLFIQQFLLGYLRLDPGKIPAIRRELRRVAAKLRSAQPVLVHRDLQSSNILIVRGRPAFIDFQGMRFGPAVYDLASLLCDPYVNLTLTQQEMLLQDYARRMPDGEHIQSLFWPAAVQRLVQALGAYARLGARRETERFRHYIPPALRMLRRAVAHATDCPTPALQAALWHV